MKNIIKTYNSIINFFKFSSNKKYKIFLKNFDPEEWIDAKVGFIELQKLLSGTYIAPLSFMDCSNLLNQIPYMRR